MSDTTSKGVDGKRCQKEYNQIFQNIAASAETALKDRRGVSDCLYDMVNHLVRYLRGEYQHAILI